MEIFLIFLMFLSCFSLSCFGESKVGPRNENGIYIVYMGAANSDSHAHLLNSVLRRKENAVVHNYRKGFSGFAAHLTEEEAHSIARKPGVVSVFPDPILQLHTTRSWDFLKYQTELETDCNLCSNSDSQSHGYDTIIGILDTGIWPESDSFSDKDLGPLPSRWKGICMEGQNFSTSNCNRKLIGARFYKESIAHGHFIQSETPRDEIGHGTHVASTAAGASISNASFYGLAAGTAKGGSPGSRIAVYRVCSPGGCRGSAILAAFDDAIADGVDILSLSLGSSPYLRPQFSTDPIAIGAFHAVEKGIAVVCSAGNDGPNRETVVNGAPWILTVAASTIDRIFESDIVLGGEKVIEGTAINFANIQKSPIYPLIYASSAKSNSSEEKEARNCNEGTLDKDLIKGKIVICDNDDTSHSPKEKLEEVKENGGIGVVLVDSMIKSVASNFGDFPMTVISSEDAMAIHSYINSIRNPVATILPTKTVTEYKPAPMVAYFSARGPFYGSKNLLKPDIAAPGVNILAAWIGDDTALTPSAKKPPMFNVISGTSMSCPHVSGVVANVKSQNPTWSPSAIRSAIMTTAIQLNNLRAPITTDSGSVATPYDYGAGEISPSGPLQPGLVYETEIVDYLEFLCYYGYSITTIKLISSSVPSGFSCPKNSKPDLISNLNYPSIAVSGFDGKESKKVNRTVTNVGDDDETTYTASSKAPDGLTVKVIPEELQFTKNNKKLSFQVEFSFTGSSAPKGDLFGSITWINGKYKVQSPFVVGTSTD